MMKINKLYLSFLTASRWNPCSSKTDVLFFPDDKKPGRSFFNTLSGNGNPHCFAPKCNYAHLKDGESTSFMQIVLTLSEAKHSIDLCVYDFTQVELKRLLIRAKKGGMSVRIITHAHPDRQKEAIQAEEGLLEVQPKEKAKVRSRSKSPAPPKKNREKQNQQQSPPQSPTDQQQPPEYNPDQISLLQKAGIPIKVNRTGNDARAGKMHNKFVIIDDDCLITGSFNWTHSAIVKNDEAVIRTRERQVVNQFIIKFNQLWEQLEIRNDNSMQAFQCA